MLCRHCEHKPFISRNALFRHISSVHEQEGTNKSKEKTVSKLTREPVIETIVDDNWLRVVVKPQGMPTMGREGSLVKSDQLMIPHAWEDCLPYKKCLPCHRLDAATGGLVVCSKSKEAERAICWLFRERRVSKVYRAIVVGKIDPKEGVIDEPLSGKESMTKYKTLIHTRSLKYGWVTTVQLHPITGRKHQLRRHLQSIGHPIIGDRRFSHAKWWPDDSGPFAGLMFLWALEITFPHPSHHLALKPQGTTEEGSVSVKAKERGVEEKQVVTEGSSVQVDTEKELQFFEATPNIPFDDDVLHCRIPEPDYFETFREIEGRSWSPL
jgi:23S rRNA pseudouridine1911/1915/1917 synthase